MNTSSSTLRFAVLAALAVLVLALVPAAFAAKGRPHGGGGSTGGTGTIKLVPLNSTDGYAHYGQKVTFEVWASSTTRPWVTVKCFQGGTAVYKQSNGIFSTSLNQIFTLGPTPSWTGGDAECTAYLENWDNYSKGKIVTITSIPFHVYA